MTSKSMALTVGVSSWSCRIVFMLIFLSNFTIGFETTTLPYRQTACQSTGFPPLIKPDLLIDKIELVSVQLVLRGSSAQRSGPRTIQISASR